MTSAETKYTEKQKEIGFQIKEIQAKLKKHAVRKNKDYGHVGDLAYVKELLSQINGFLR